MWVGIISNLIKLVVVIVIGGNYENINEICYISDGYDIGCLC